MGMVALRGAPDDYTSWGLVQRLREGIVIGSDTVVYLSQGRLVLKPRDLKEAKKNLKELMSKPHWVYS
ncbi:MAG: Maf family protein, partial [Acidimicrobiales bacterium]